MIPHNRPTLGLEEQAAVCRVIESGWIAQGPEVDAFESDLSEFFGIPRSNVVVVSSGSAALYLALWALNSNRKKIGIPAYSCSALRNAVGYVGGFCHFLDCATDSPNLDAKAVTGTDIDILIAPSLFGLPIELPESRTYRVVEDLAQALGAKVKNERIGLRGDIGVCSFYATKMITSGGQGGAVISRDTSLVNAIRDYREFDSRDDAKLRFNFQMTDMQAAIGRVQLKQLSSFIKKRQHNFSVYQRAGLDMLDNLDPTVEPVRYRAVMRCSEPNRVIKALASAGIKAIIPIETKELLDDPINYPQASTLSKTTVSLPIYPSLTDSNLIKIAKIAGDAV